MSDTEFDFSIPHRMVNGVPVPLTSEEIKEEADRASAWEHEQIEKSQNAYKELRKSTYPPMSDYIDGIVKGDQAQVDAYISACLAVKVKYPKP